MIDIFPFFSNLIATIIGVILGLPLALLTNRLIVSIEQKKERIKIQNRTYKALQYLINPIDANIGLMVKLQETIIVGKGKINFEINYSAWEGIKSDIIQYVQNPILKYDASRYFTRMKYLIKVNDYYLSLLFMVINCNKKSIKVILDENLKNTSFYLCEQLIPELIIESNKLKNNITSEMRFVRSH
jgi:hypothetical protein